MSEPNRRCESIECDNPPMPGRIFCADCHVRHQDGASIGYGHFNRSGVPFAEYWDRFTRADKGEAER